MAVNNDFLGSITDALINRTVEPGKLDDITQKFSAVVKGLEKSEKALGKFAVQMQGVFAQATKQARQQAPPGSLLPTARELTEISNKLFKPLYEERSRLVRENSELARAFSSEVKANRAFEQGIKNRLIGQQAKLESRATNPRENFTDQRKEAFGRRNASMAEAFARIQTQLDSVLKSSTVGLEKQLYGLTRNARVMVMDLEATNKHALELHARLVEFDKETGRLGKVVEEYTAYQRYANLRLSTARRFDQALLSGTGPLPRDVRFVGRKGLSLAQLTDAPGISSMRVMRMASKADVAIGHYPPGDLQRLSAILPKLAHAVTWLDSSRDIPWKMLGFPTRGQQSLLVPHGISTGTGVSGAHRALGDVDTLIKLLNSSHPQGIGGRSYADMMFRKAVGPGTSPEAQFHAFMVDKAREMHRDVVSTIKGERRYGAGSDISDRPEDRGKITAKGHHDPAQESTPPQLGLSGLHLDASKRSLEEFLRNSLIVPASMMSTLYAKHAEIAQSQVQTLGLGRHRDDVRTGEDLSLRIMRGVNDEIDMQRSVSSKFRLGTIPLLPDVLRGRESPIERQLTQPWARPPRQFSTAEINAFVGKYKNSPSVEAIQPAAQMAASVGLTGHKYFDLTNIMLAGQSAGRAAANTRAAMAQRDAMKQISGGVAGEPRIGSVKRRLIERERMMVDAAKATAATIVSPFTSAGGIGGGSFGTFYKYFAGKRGASAAGAGGPADVRAEMRYDALQAKLRKLADTVDATVKSFQHFEQAVAPQRRRAADAQYAERDLAIGRGLAGGRISLETQGRRLAARGARASSLASRRDEAILFAQQSLENNLGFSALEAQTSLDFARERQVRRSKQLSSIRDARGKLKYTPKEISAMVDPMTALPGMRAARAEYAYKSAGLLPGQELEELRHSTAEKYALARYGTGSGEKRKIHGEFADASQVYQAQVEELLVGDTLEQKAQRKRSAIAEDKKATQEELGAQEADRTKRVELLEQGAQQKRAVNAQKLGEKKKKIDDDVAQNAMKAQKKVEGLEEAGRAARTKFAKQEAALAGRGAGAGRGSGTGAGAGGGRFGAGAQSGYGFGMGFMALVAYDAALKTLVKDMAIYSARTEMMEMATGQMARTSGLSVDQVNAEVEAIKKLNVTTQVAHQTVQRFMMMQIDLAKASKLVAVAQDLAAISGADAMETVSRLSQAVLTGYTRNLHMMGLQVTALSVMADLKRERKAAGKTGAPSIVEQRQALTNAILLEGAKVSGTYERTLSTAGGQFAYLRKEVQETMNVLGKEFLPTFAEVMLSLTSGLKAIQGSAEGFADLAKALVSVGTAATLLGTGSFLWTGIKALGKLNPWVAGAGAAIGIGTYMYLDQDKAGTYKDVAGQQNVAFAERRKTLAAERDRFAAIASPSDAEKNSLKLANESLRSLDREQALSAEDLTKKLAEEYNKRKKDLDEYLASMEGKRSFWSQAWSSVKGTPEQTLLGKIWADVPFVGDTGAEAIDRAKKQRAELLEKIAKDSGKSPGALSRKAQELHEKSERSVALPSKIVNEVNQRVNDFLSSFQASEQAINKLEAGLDPVTGSIAKRARKLFGTPREKAQIDYEFQKAELDSRYKELDDLEKARIAGAAGNATEQEFYQKAVIRKGGGTSVSDDEQAGGAYSERGRKLIQDALDERDKLREENEDLRSSEFGKIVAQTNAQIARINEQVQVERILGNVVAGNYASEEAGLAAVLELKKKNIDLGKTVLKADVDAAREARAAAKADAERARDALVQKATLAARERARVDLQNAAEVQARDIMEAPGADRLEATARSYDALIAENEANERDNAKKLSERQRLQYEKQKALHQVQLQRAGMVAQANVTIFENAQRVAEAMAGSSAFDSMFGRRTELEQGKVDIERRRGQQLAAAQYTYAQMSQVPGQDVDELKQRRAEAVDAANTQAREDAVKLQEDLKRSAGERLAKRYEQSLGIKEQTLHGLTTSEAQEKVAAKNVHELRLRYIQMEFEARGKTLEAERTRNQEILEEESAKLHEMLAERRKQVEEIKAFGSEFFMTAITDHARGLRDMLFGKVKGMGATVAGNALGMLLGKAKFSIPGLETIDKEGVHHATKLGELLSGTVLGTKVPSEKEVQEQLAKVTTLNSTATQDNTSALRSLTDAAITIMQHLGIAYTPVPRTIPAVSTGPSYTKVPDFTPIFGGAGQDNPMIMHLQGGGGVASPYFGGGGAGSSLYGLGLPQFGGGTGSSSSILGTIGMLSSLGAPLDAAASQRRLQQMLSSTNFAKAAKGTSPSGLIAMMKAGQDLSGFGGGGGPSVIFKGLPGGGGAPGGGGGGGSGGGRGGGSGSNALGKYVMGAIMTGTGIYQAATNFGKGARGDLFGAGGVLQAGAGIASMIPGGQAVAAGLEIASMLADLTGSLFMDPKQKRANQMANYLGMLQYMAPAQIAMTSSLQGNMVSEGRGGGVTDTGIRSNALQVTSPYMESINPNPAWYSQPLQYLLGSNRPSVYQAPGLPTGQFPSADSLQGSEQYNYAGVPGTVLYNDLPGNAVPTNYATMNVNINALDSKSVIDRAPDIAAAIQKQLQLGGSLAASLQSAVFGVG